MKCPECNGKTKIIDTRADLDSVVRRRECSECGYRFTTTEVDADWLNKIKQSTQKIKIKLDKGAKMPTRAHTTDAGLDIYCPEGQAQIIPAKESTIFDTGVHIELPINTAGMLKSKSGLNVNHGITSEGVIDVGYTGSIKVKLYNNSGYDYEVREGDKITQLVIVPILTPSLDLVDELTERGRGNNGFGSSGR